MRIPCLNISNRGTALVLTLWLLALLSALALNFALSSRTGSAITRNFKESVAMRALAVSAIENTVAYLLTDPDPLVDYVDHEGNLRTDSERPLVANSITDGNTTVKLSLSAEDARMTISVPNEALLINLISLEGTSEEDTRTMVSALMDWIDPDDLYRLNGAEDDYYEAMGYSTSGMPLVTTEELMLIKGFDKEIVMGKDGSGGLADKITTFAKTVNINAAPLEVLESLGLNPVSASSIIDMRESNKGLRHVPASIARAGTTFSNVFRIEARASQDNSPQVYRIISIVKRVAGKRSQELKTIYWKEDIEAGGA